MELAERAVAGGTAAGAAGAIAFASASLVRGGGGGRAWREVDGDVGDATSFGSVSGLDGDAASAGVAAAAVVPPGGTGRLPADVKVTGGMETARACVGSVTPLPRAPRRRGGGGGRATAGKVGEVAAATIAAAAASAGGGGGAAGACPLLPAPATPAGAAEVCVAAEVPVVTVKAAAAAVVSAVANTPGGDMATVASLDSSATYGRAAEGWGSGDSLPGDGEVGEAAGSDPVEAEANSVEVAAAAVRRVRGWFKRDSE